MYLHHLQNKPGRFHPKIRFKSFLGCSSFHMSRIHSDSVVCSTSDDPIIDDCICNSFTVSGPGSIAPPVICGYNTEHHMYVAASDDCNTIAFNFAVGKSFDREWEIKVQQYYLKDIININIKGIIYLLTSLLSDKYEAIIFLLLIRLCALQHNSLFVDRLFFQTF